MAGFAGDFPFAIGLPEELAVLVEVGDTFFEPEALADVEVPDGDTSTSLREMTLGALSPDGEVLAEEDFSED